MHRLAIMGLFIAMNLTLYAVNAQCTLTSPTGHMTVNEYSGDPPDDYRAKPEYEKDDLYICVDCGIEITV